MEYSCGSLVWIKFPGEYYDLQNMIFDINYFSLEFDMNREECFIFSDALYYTMSDLYDNVI